MKAKAIKLVVALPATVLSITLQYRILNIIEADDTTRLIWYMLFVGLLVAAIVNTLVDDK